MAIEAIDPIQGIPQSTAPPQGMIGAFGENPWDVDDDLLQQEQRAWRQNAFKEVDTAVTDPNKFFGDQDLGFGADVKQGRMLATNDLFLKAANDGENVPVRGPEREALRNKVAFQFFNGLGAKSEEEFNGQIVNYTTQKNQRRETYSELQKEAWKSAVVSEADPDSPNPFTWEAFHEKAKSRPGYKPDDVVDLRVAWNEATQELRQKVEPFREELSQVWGAMKGGGKGSLSEVLKEGGDMANPAETIIKMGVESQREDAAATAYRIYSDLSDEERPMFLDALGVVARSFPKEEQEGFFNNLIKQGGRSIDDFGSNIGKVPPARITWDTIIPGLGPTSAEVDQKLGIDREGILRKINFQEQVRKIERGEFSPIKYLSDQDSYLRIAEEGSYGVPGAIFTSSVAAFPYLGAALVYSSMQGDAYSQIRDNLVAGGMSEIQASQRAMDWSPIVAIPNAALEKLQAKAVLGQLPLFESTMRAIGDRIGNIAVRGAIRTGVGAAEESFIELGQDYMASIVQDVASALQQDVPEEERIPGVEWKNGSTGILDGFWTQYATTMVTMLPLAAFGGAGGISNDQRVRAFSEATDTQMMALGASPDSIASFREASSRGLDSGASALDEMIATLDPQSETAKAATEAMISEQEAAVEAVRLSQDSGAFPTISQSADGWTVTDRNTGVQYGPVSTSDQAVKLAQENFSAVQSASANQMDYLTSMLESVDAASKLDRPGSQTDTVVDLGLRMTPEIMQAASPQAAEDLRLQIEAMEKAGELTPGLARIVYGVSQTDADRRQRQTVNKLYQGSSVATVFHEYFHGIRREAFAQKRITPEEETDFLMAMDEEFKASKNKRNMSLGLLPEGISRDQVTEKMRDEAISKLAEAEVLKSRRGGAGRNTQTRDSVLNLPAGVVTRNIRSLVRKGLKSAKKFSDLFNAVRGYFGVAMGRAVILRQLDRKGSPASGKYQEYLSKLTGLTEQDLVDRKAQEVAQDITGNEASFSVGDEILDPLISNSVDRIKDPKQQAAAFQRIVDNLRRLRQVVFERGVAFGQEQFSGTDQESALADLDKRRADALATFENRVIETSRPQAKLEYERELAKIDAAEQKLTQRGALSDQRQGIIDALATFDGILSALPPDLRGRIGGFTQLASLTTNEARLKFLEGRLEKAETVIESYLKKEYGRLFDKLLERAAPKAKAGKKPTGKLGGDVHDLFRTIEDAKTWDSDRADTYALSLESQIGTGNLTPSQEAHVALEAQMVRMVADWKNTNAEDRAKALEAATSIYESGYARFKLATLMRAEDRKIRINNLKKDTGKEGTPGERDRKMLADNGLKGGWKDSMLSLISFEQTAEYIFGRGSKDAVEMVDSERKAANQYEDRFQDKAEGLQNFYATLGGSSLAGEKIQYRMLQKNIKVGDRTLSEEEIVDALMMYRQEDGKRHFEGRKDENGNPSGPWHYGADWIAEAESKLTEDGRSLMAFLSDQYASEWSYINPLYEEINGVNLPYNALYSPISVAPQVAQAGEIVDPVTGNASSALSSTPSWAKSRGNAIAEPKFIAASQKYLAHTKQVEQWMAYAAFIRDYASPIRDRELGNSIAEKGGEKALTSIRLWMDHFQQGGNRDAGAQLALNQFMTRVAGRAASTALIGRMGVLAIQATQIGAAAAEMPLSSYLYRLGKLTSGQLDYTEALKSDFIQRRIKQLPPAVRAAMEGLKGTNPNALKFAQRKMGEIIGGVDGLVTAGTFAIIYDYQLKQAEQLGYTGEEAKQWARNEAERSTERIAQPTRSGTRSLFENTGGGPALRIVYSFASEARQKLALSAWRIASKDRSLGEKARAVAVTWVVGGLFASMIRAAIRDIKEDDDEEKTDPWDAKRLFLSSLTGPLQGIPFLGEEIESAIWKTSGEYMPSGTLLGSIPNAFSAATRVVDWGDSKPDEIIKDVDQIFQGLGLFSDNVASASSLIHLARDLYDLGENAVD